MSYKTPIIPSLTLKGIDKKIQDIQSEMDMSWLTKSFGLAERYVVKGGDEDIIIPACFEGNTIDPISMMPSDLYNAFCFWVKNPVAEVNSTQEIPIVTYNVSCIFYMDLRRIDNTVPYKETMSKIREDIYNFFRELHFAGKLVLTGTVEDDITQIYSGYSIEQIDNVKKAFPRWAMRLNFELSYRDDCYVLNTYTHT